MSTQNNPKTSLNSLEQTNDTTPKSPTSIKKGTSGNGDSSQIKKKTSKPTQGVSQKAPQDHRGAASPQSIKKKIPKAETPIERPETPDVSASSQVPETPTPTPGSSKKRIIKKKKSATPSDVEGQRLDDNQTQSSKVERAETSSIKSPEITAPSSKDGNHLDPVDEDEPSIPELTKDSKLSQPIINDRAKKMIKKKKPIPIPEPVQQPEPESEEFKEASEQEQEQPENSARESDDNGDEEEEEQESVVHNKSDEEAQSGEEQYAYTDEEANESISNDDHQFADEEDRENSSTKAIEEKAKNTSDQVSDTADDLPSQAQKKSSKLINHTADSVQKTAPDVGDETQKSLRSPINAAEDLIDNVASRSSGPKNQNAVKGVKSPSKGLAKKKKKPLSEGVAGLTDSTSEVASLDKLPASENTKKTTTDFAENVKPTADDASREAISGAPVPNDSGVDVERDDLTPSGDKVKEALKNSSNAIDGVKGKAGVTATGLKGQAEQALSGSSDTLSQDPQGVIDAATSKIEDTAKSSQDAIPGNVGSAEGRFEDLAEKGKDSAGDLAKQGQDTIPSLNKHQVGATSQSKYLQDGSQIDTERLGSSVTKNVASRIQLPDGAGEVSLKSNGTSDDNGRKGGIEISVSTTRDATTITIKIPGV